MNKLTDSSVFYLKDLIDIKPGRIASRNLSLPVHPDGAATEQEWVLYAMDQQETISAETSPLHKLIQVLDGELSMMVAGQARSLTTGMSIIVPAHTWHEFEASKSCIFLQISL
ncbi:cupin domain-containing protein [Paenibacillus massiliensis]|uniref:cupin domain-containing protein n=1 Tax=Paenibacillus massiliensis TaxID=225917 RepID=UPI0003FB759A|nr:cupin domain-containing protein [Paenibacillus massiliensis]